MRWSLGEVPVQQDPDYRFVLYSTPIGWDLGSAVTTR